jgi:hypothetical protein
MNDTIMSLDKDIYLLLVRMMEQAEDYPDVAEAPVEEMRKQVTTLLQDYDMNVATPGERMQVQFKLIALLETARQAIDSALRVQE